MQESRYMLRIWQEEESAGEVWQASVKNLESKEVRYFASFSSFQVFISETLRLSESFDGNATQSALKNGQVCD